MLISSISIKGKNLVFSGIDHLVKVLAVLIHPIEVLILHGSLRNSPKMVKVYQSSVRLKAFEIKLFLIEYSLAERLEFRHIELCKVFFGRTAIYLFLDICDCARSVLQEEGALIKVVSWTLTEAILGKITLRFRRLLVAEVCGRTTAISILLHSFIIL